MIENRLTLLGIVGISNYPEWDSWEISNEKKINVVVIESSLLHYLVYRIIFMK